MKGNNHVNELGLRFFLQTGETALSYASAYGYLSIVQTLLAAGANPNTKVGPPPGHIHC